MHLEKKQLLIQKGLEKLSTLELIKGIYDSSEWYRRWNIPNNKYFVIVTIIKSEISFPRYNNKYDLF